MGAARHRWLGAFCFQPIINNKIMQKNLKIFFTIVIGVLAIGAVVSLIKNVDAPGDSQTKTQAVLNDPAINWPVVYDLINKGKENGFIKKIELSSTNVYILPTWWNSFNVEQKESFARSAAYYMAKERNDDVVMADIYDWQSGARLAQYSRHSGLTVEQ